MMNEVKDVNYEGVLKIVSQWPTSQKLRLVREVMKTISPRVELPKQHMRTLEQALGLLATDQPGPTDAEIEQWLDERRMEK